MTRSLYLFTTPNWRGVNWFVLLMLDHKSRCLSVLRNTKQVQTTDPFVVVNYLRLLSKNICSVYCGLSICFNNTLVKLTLLLTVLI